MRPTAASVLGARLRQRRRARGLSLQQVEAALGGEIRASTLGSYERRDREITAYRLTRLAALYGTTAPFVLRECADAAGRPVGSVLRLDMRAVRSGVATPPLQRWALSVLAERGTPDAQVLDVVPSDQLAVAAMLDVWPGGLRDHLEAIGALWP